MTSDLNLGSVLALFLLVACDPSDGSVTATATATATSTGGEEEDICGADDDFPNPLFMLLDQFEEEFDFQDVLCEVRAAGFDCEGQIFEVDGMFEPFGPLPWTEGQAVRLTTDAFWFTVSEVAIRSEGGELLAVMSSRPDGMVGPITISTEPSGCENPEQPRIVLLEATYTIAGESITLAGRRAGTLLGFEIFQTSAEDISEISAGEINEGVSFVAIASS